MDESGLSSILIVYTEGLLEELVQEAIYGIEEEGCNYTLRKITNTEIPVETTSGVTIVVNNDHCSIVTSEVQPPITILEATTNKSSLRRTGKNAGRYIKGMKLEI